MTKRFNAFTLAEGATHVATSNNKHSFGFTLAEVLITLGIIGVVAAMTMPTLINQTNGAQYKAAYKKALSAISQAVTLNVALDDSSFADTEAGTAGTETVDAKGNTTIASLLVARMNRIKTTNENDSGYGKNNVREFPAKITTKACFETKTVNGEQVKEVKACGEDDTPETGEVKPNTYMFFNDGMMFAFDATNAKCTKSEPCYGAIDVNGLKGPNLITENAEKPNDIYPVQFYDQTILPASEAAKAVLYGK